MFNKQHQGGKEIETIIGPSVKVEGDFVCSGGIVVDGELKGSVKTNAYLQIGNKALVEGGVEAENAKISGSIKGNVKVNGYLELTDTARIHGDLEAQVLSVASGASLNGRCLVTLPNKGKKMEIEPIEAKD